MSASDSNLNSVGYDMVVGLTQNSINNTMKTFLEPMDAPLGPVIYVYTDGSLTDVRMLTPDETTALMEQADPFSIPDGTTSDSSDAAAVAAGNILFDALFFVGFKATMGLPIDPSLGRTEYFEAMEALPNILTLHTEDSAQTVDYDLYYKDFQIAKQIGGRGTFWSYENFEQPADAPWIFNYAVNLNLSTDSTTYSSLNDQQKEAFSNLENLDPNTMFSINQLMLDLTTPMLSSSPVITGIDPNDPSYAEITALLGQFTTSYWDALSASGDVVFSASVAPILEGGTTTALPPSTLTPGDLNFIVKVYDSEGESLTDQEKQDLNTLNYLIMQQGSSLPTSLNNITWDWLNKAEDISYDGIMSVRRDIFVDHLFELLNPKLNLICLDPSPQIHGPDNIFADSRDYYAVNYSQASNPASYIKGQNENALYTNTWTSGPYTQKDSSYGDMTCTNWATSNITIEGNQIICECEIISYLSINLYHPLNVTHTNVDGYVYASNSRNVMTLGISPTGQITVEADTTTTDMVDNSNYNYSSGQLYDPSVFDKAAGRGVLDCTDQMKVDCASALDGAMASFQDQIVSLLTGVTGWVFPGGTTFTFSNCAFSDTQDFLSMITYSDPT